MSTVPPTTSDEPAPELRILDEELDIALLPGEELLIEGTPNRRPLANFLTLSWIFVAALTCFGLLALPFILWAARVYAQKHKYWITTNRVIVANGLIGYNVRSIPLERISDIAVRCSWLEKMFGLRSVVVRDMTGEAQTGAVLMAVPDAPTMQAHVLDYVRQVNRQVGNTTDAKKLAATPYRNVEPMGHDQKLVKLLERIEENTRHLPKLRVESTNDDSAALEEAALAEAEAEAEAAAQRR